MAIAQNFPEISPSLDLSFALTKKLDPRVTFARASTGAYYGQTVAKAEENLLLRSQEFDNASWVPTGVSVTANSTASPDGTTTAETLTDGGSGSVSHVISQSSAPSVSALGVYAASVFVKDVDLGYFTLSVRRSSGNSARATFDLGAETTATSTQGTGVAALSSSITSVGNGWYRCGLIVEITIAVSSGNFTAGLWDGVSTSEGTSGQYLYTASGKSIFIWGAQLEQRSAVTAYTPTTDQPITNYIPVLETASANVARFDHSPTTSESLGLLVEEQRTNLALYSEDFGNAVWVEIDTGVTSVLNTVVAPDGLLTADKIVESSNTSFQRLLQSITIASVAHTVSFYAKQAERQWLLVRESLNAVNTTSWFDLATGSLGTVGAGRTATITNVGNGWYRCTLTATGVAGLRFISVGPTTGNNTETYTGDGYSGIYIWGAQLEAGAFPTSYIPTVASQVTRAADSASMTGANFSEWYRQDEGTIYSETITNRVLSFRTFSISDGTTNNRIQHYQNSNGKLGLFIATNNSTVADINSVASYGVNDLLKSASVYKTNDSALCFNQETPVIDTNVTLSNNLFSAYIGNLNGTTTGANWIKKIAYYPARLTNVQLQALTS